MLFGRRLSGNRLVLLSGTLLSAVGWGISWGCVREVKVSEEPGEGGEMRIEEFEARNRQLFPPH